jgi:hypothetical protein
VRAGFRLLNGAGRLSPAEPRVSDFDSDAIRSAD